MNRKSVFLALILFCASLLPAYAQTTTTTTTTTKRTTKTTRVRGTANARARAWADATRLGALLRDVQANVNVDAAVWRTVVNEANALANRVYADTARSSTARNAARSARMHVREMRTAALTGDAAGARTHASEAMPFVMKVVDWAAPK